MHSDSRTARNFRYSQNYYIDCGTIRSGYMGQDGIDQSVPRRFINEYPHHDSIPYMALSGTRRRRRATTGARGICKYKHARTHLHGTARGTFQRTEVQFHGTGAVMKGNYIPLKEQTCIRGKEIGTIVEPIPFTVSFAWINFRRMAVALRIYWPDVLETGMSEQSTPQTETSFQEAGYREPGWWSSIQQVECRTRRILPGIQLQH